MYCYKNYVNVVRVCVSKYLIVLSIPFHLKEALYSIPLTNPIASITAPAL